jgi:small neutral amino acid transporter SnatA (MarC family)
MSNPVPTLDLIKPLIALLAIVNPIGAVPFSWPSRRA